MKNELTFFFSFFPEYHCKLINLDMYNTFQSIAIIIPLMLKLFHLWPAAPSLCPCILSDMTPPNLPCSLHDRMFHLAHVLFPDLESAVSVQSPDFSLEMVFRDPLRAVLAAASWSLFLTFSVDRARKHVLYLSCKAKFMLPVQIWDCRFPTLSR